MTRAWLRPLAEQDLIDRAGFYRSHASADIAGRFVDAAIAALRAAERMPGAGSPRVGELCGVPGLRAWPVRGFPVRWYSFVNERRLDVVRLLADAQDLVAILGGDAPE